MAVELITGYGGENDHNRFATTTSTSDDDNAIAVQEAASAGIHSVEKLMNMISQQNHHHHQQQQEEANNNVTNDGCELIGAVADVAVNRFREVIALLDRPRTGHARFRRAPPTLPQPVPLLQLQQTVESNSNSSKPIVPSSSSSSFVVQPQQLKTKTEQVSGSAFKVYCPPPPPPPPKNNNELAAHGSIKFSVSAANSSFVSTLTGDSENLQQRPCRSSSGFQISHVSLQGSSYMRNKPPLSSNSTKRKCNSVDFPGIKCGSSSSAAQCHCSKKRHAFILSCHNNFFFFIVGSVVFIYLVTLHYANVRLK